MQLKEVKLMNETMITYLKKMEKNSQRNEIISKILKDEACFFKMQKSDAYIILEDIGVAKDKIQAVYLNLIAADNYFKLKETGKIKEEDTEIIIKYKNYDSNELFKNKK